MGGFGQPGSFPTQLTVAQLQDLSLGFPANNEAVLNSSIAKFNLDYGAGALTSLEAAWIFGNQFWPVFDANAEVFTLNSGVAQAKATDTLSVSGYAAGEAVSISITGYNGEVYTIPYTTTTADANAAGVAASLQALAAVVTTPLLSPNGVTYPKPFTLTAATSAVSGANFTWTARVGGKAGNAIAVAVTSGTTTKLHVGANFIGGADGATGVPVFHGTPGSTARYYAAIPRYPLTQTGNAGNPGGVYLNQLPGAPPEGRANAPSYNVVTGLAAMPVTANDARKRWVGNIGPFTEVDSTSSTLTSGNYVTVTAPSVATLPLANPPNQAVTPAAMTNIVVGQHLVVDSTTSQEMVVVLSKTATTFSAYFTKTHTTSYNIVAPTVSTTLSGSPIVAATTALFVTPAALTNINVGDQLVIDTGGNAETIVVLAKTASQIQAVFKNSHALGVAIVNVTLSTTGSTNVTSGLLSANVLFDIVATNSDGVVQYLVAKGLAPGATANDTGVQSPYAPYAHSEVYAGPQTGTIQYTPPISFTEGLT